MNMLDVYVEAYNNRIKNTAILNGLYTNIAILSAIRQSFSEEENSDYYGMIVEMEGLSGEIQEQKEEQFQEEKNFWSTLKSRQRE